MRPAADRRHRRQPVGRRQVAVGGARGVIYCFSHTDQAMPLALPQPYSTGGVVRIPMQPQTVGDHIRKRPLGLKLLQRDVPAQLGVNKTSVFNWEANTAKPEIQYMPAIIDFLWYNPLPAATGWRERLVRYRTTLGMTQKEAAGRLGVDQGTLAKCEQGKREPACVFLGRVKRFLQDGEAPGARRSGQANGSSDRATPPAA